jgi:hypothetical protein
MKAKRKVNVWQKFVINPEKPQGKQDEDMQDGRKRRGFSRATPEILSTVLEESDYRERNKLFAKFEEDNPARCELDSYRRYFRARISEREQGIAV